MGLMIEIDGKKLEKELEKRCLIPAAVSDELGHSAGFIYKCVKQNKIHKSDLLLLTRIYNILLDDIKPDPKPIQKKIKKKISNEARKQRGKSKNFISVDGEKLYDEVLLRGMTLRDFSESVGYNMYEASRWHRGNYIPKRIITLLKSVHDIELKDILFDSDKGNDVVNDSKEESVTEKQKEKKEQKEIKIKDVKDEKETDETKEKEDVLNNSPVIQMTKEEFGMFFDMVFDKIGGIIEERVSAAIASQELKIDYEKLGDVIAERVYKAVDKLYNEPYDEAKRRKARESLAKKFPEKKEAKVEPKETKKIA